MPDTKTSDESAASALTGTELVRIVQSAASVRTTTQAIADLGGGGGDLALISTLTANNTATSLEWTGLTGKNYLLLINALQPATNAASILLQFGQGGTPTWATGAAAYHWNWHFQVDASSVGDQNGTAAGIIMASAIDNSGGGLVSGRALIFGLSSAITHAAMFESLRLNGGVLASVRGFGHYTTDTAAVTALRLITSAGNLASGTASLFVFS